MTSQPGTPTPVWPLEKRQWGRPRVSIFPPWRVCHWAGRAGPGNHRWGQSHGSAWRCSGRTWHPSSDASWGMRWRGSGSGCNPHGSGPALGLWETGTQWAGAGPPQLNSSQNSSQEMHMQITLPGHPGPTRMAKMKKINTKHTKHCQGCGA